MSLRQNRLCSLVCRTWFSYQSECHCAKTPHNVKTCDICLVTSQNVTAPKHLYDDATGTVSLVTSQNVTAPKHAAYATAKANRLVTSQNVTAPKHLSNTSPLLFSLVTSQNVTAPKLNTMDQIMFAV